MRSPHQKKIILSKKIFNLKDYKRNNVLFKDKLNFKYPGGAFYHKDGHFIWQDENNKYQKSWKNILKILL